MRPPQAAKWLADSSPRLARIFVPFQEAGLERECSVSWNERNVGLWPTLIRSPHGRKGNMMLNRLHVFTIMTLTAVNKAFAQATPPAAPGSPPAPAPADDGSGASWLWIILGLAILAALAWYFMRGRSRTTATGSGTATSHPKVFDNDKRK